MFAGFEAILTLVLAGGGLLMPLLIELLGVRLALTSIGLLARHWPWPPVGPRSARLMHGCACAMQTLRFGRQ
jgi:hypothetical protein